MQIIPAIDLSKGRCVRLFKGREGTETVFSENPVEFALKWEEYGAKIIHLVDLDGAFSGEPRNYEVIRGIIHNVSCKIQIGGGIRDVETVDRYIQAGAERIIIGTAAFGDDGFLVDICTKYPGRIAVGIDTREGKIAVRGWRETLNHDISETIQSFTQAGVSLIIHTNIDRDGTMEGADFSLFESFISSSSIPVVASGGIASLDDIEKLTTLEEIGLYGVILGKSIYTGDIDLGEAIKRYS